MELGKELLYLSDLDEQKLGISMDAVMDTLEEVHMARRQDRVQMPPKPNLTPMGRGVGFIDAYTACVSGTDYVGVKWLSGYFGNPARGLPFITGLVIVNDPETGVPLSVMSCAYLTALRTAGINGVAMRKTVKPDTKVVGVVGCGLQARTHLMAAMAVCPGIEEVYCWSPRETSAVRYVEEMGALFPNVKIQTVATCKEAVTCAELLIIGAPLVFDDSNRIIEAGWLKKGVTVAAVNGDASFLREALGEFDRVIVDDRDAYPVRREKSMVDPALTDVCAEIALILLGQEQGRTSDDERILINTEGMAINDVSVARTMYETALEKGVGTILPL